MDGFFTFKICISNRSKSPAIQSEIITEPLLDEEMIYLPNIFSPDNDGSNDCFTSSICS